MAIGSVQLSSKQARAELLGKPGSPASLPNSAPARLRYGIPAFAALASMFAYMLAVQAQSSGPVPAKVEALYREGVSLVESGRLAEAQRVLLQAESRAPANLEIKITLGKLDALLGQNDDAIRLFREVETQAPGNRENQINLAIALAAHGLLEEALVPATKAVTSSPRSLAAHHIRGKILAGIHRDADARTEYEMGLALAPRDVLTLYDYAQFCEETGRLVEEVPLLRRLLEVRPAKAQYHFMLGRVLSRTGDGAGSRREYREAIRLDPSNRAALYSLARAMQKDDSQEAARLTARFRALQASEEDLNAIRSQGNQGVSAMQAHDWPRAVEIFEAALAACAGCTLEATLEKDLGLSQCQGGQLEAGVLSLRRSLALNPNDLDTLHALEIAERASPTSKN